MPDFGNLTLPLMWIAIAVVAAIFEGVTVQLVSIWFTVGAVISAIVSVFNDNVLVQLAVFIIVSVVCIVITRPLADRLKKTTGEIPTNCDRYIGKTAEVIVDINNDEAVGQVRVDGSVWSAKSTTSDILKVGTKVKVNSIQGVKMLVTPMSE